MKQLLYTYSSFYKPTLTKWDFSSSKTRGYFLYPDIIAPFNDKAFIKKLTFFLITYLFFIATSFAQQKISGVVTTPTGLPLSGATISIKGSKIATATNADGSFIIMVKANDVLLISYVGYNTKQIVVGNKTNSKISLVPSISDLDQVVVTGYTSQKIKEIAGSVAVVNPKDLIVIPAGQAEQMLQGRVAGLTVITSGMPGGGSNVRLHGIGNFGDVTPLYIIDGVKGDINNLNPDDIESLQVLKDAGAAAIYGVRASNGVIVITTKKGNGETKITYDFYVGKQFPSAKGYNQLTPQQEADLQWRRYRNSGWVDPLTGHPTDPIYGNGAEPVLPDYLVDGGSGIQGRYMGNDPAVDPSLNNIDFRAGPIYQILKTNKTGTDWFHALFRPAISQNHSITISGSNDRNKYLFSLGYLDQQGTMIYTYLKRYTARVNTAFNIKNNIRVGENMQVSFRDNPKIANQAPIANNNYIQEINLTLQPMTDIKGNWWNPFGNPVAQRNLYKNDKETSWDIFGNAFAEADFLKNFTARTSFGGTLTNYFYHFSFYGSYEPAAGIYPANSSWIGSGYVHSWTWTNTLSYSKIFSRNHNVKALIGTEAISNSNREISAQSNGFFIFDPSYISLLQNGAVGHSSNSFAGRSALYSIISRFEYDLGDKYIFTGTLRRDGSSVFSPRERYGWFPSLDAAYRVGNENFLKKMPWLNDLKIRASWGITGYDGNTDPTSQFHLFGGGYGDAYYDIGGTSTSIVRGFRSISIGDPNAGWQQDIISNAGFDAMLWNGKLSITADVYKKVSSGVLFPADLPAVLGGADRPNINIGNVKNTGVDLLLSSKGNFSKNWSWDFTSTFSTYKNKILKLNGDDFFFDPDIFNGSNEWVKNEVGHPMGLFYGFKVIGIFQDEKEVKNSPSQKDSAIGRFRYFDANHDGKIDESDRVFIGDPNPKFTAGFNIGFGYKNFYFSAFLYGSFGNDVLNLQNPHGGERAVFYHSWTTENKTTDIPIAEALPNFSTFGSPNSFSIENGSYLKNKSLILGYTLPAKILRRYKIDKIRVYVQAVNLFTITSYTGLDPELTGVNTTGNDNLEIRVTTPQYLTKGPSAAFGIDYGNYPNNQKQYLFGLSVSF